MSSGSESQQKFVVAVVGGAVSGAEAAATLAVNGIEVVVFEQNDRPYGKIEDGLPRWHDKQRAQEYERINGKLARPEIHFVPRTKLGRDLDFGTLTREWGFSAILLAIGSWRDRPVGVEGVDDYIGRGLVYQNPLVHWFNHYPDPRYAGVQYVCEDDAIVLGGGLASFDVAKILMLETVARALRERGVACDVVGMEHKGIAAVLKDHSLTLEALGVKGCTLFYRRRALDMPVAAYKDGATPEERKKTEEVRERLLANAMAKYLFRFQPNHLPIGGLVEDGRLVGMRFIRTEIQGNKVVKLPGTEVEYRSRMVISSIGSIPEPLAGIPQVGEFYQFAEGAAARLEGHDNVFGLGNVVTGKGNIAVSRKHGAMVAEYVTHEFCGIPGGSPFAGAESAAHAQTEKVAHEVRNGTPLTGEQFERLLARVRAQQAKAGYGGDYRAWIEQVMPHAAALAGH